MKHPPRPFYPIWERFAGISGHWCGTTQKDRVTHVSYPGKPGRICSSFQSFPSLLGLPKCKEYFLRISGQPHETPWRSVASSTSRTVLRSGVVQKYSVLCMLIGTAYSGFGSPRETPPPPPFQGVSRK